MVRALALVVLVVVPAGCSISRHHVIDHGHCMMREQQRIVGIKIGDTEYTCHKSER